MNLVMELNYIYAEKYPNLPARNFTPYPFPLFLQGQESWINKLQLDLDELKRKPTP